MRLISLGMALLLVTQAGCYWKYENVAGDPFPKPLQVQPTSASAGVQVNPNSSQPDASSITKTAVVELLVERLSEDRVFNPVIFPYSALAKAEPGVILDAKVVIEEKHNMGENMVKAIFTGLSFFLLGPVLPTRFGIVVDLQVAASSIGGEPIGTYSYKSEYDFRYTTMTPSQEKMEEWLEVAKSHAVEQVLNLIKADREKFVRYSTSGRVNLFMMPWIANHSHAPAA